MRRSRNTSASSRMQPRDWNTANILGDLYVRAGQIDKAVEQFVAHRRQPERRGLPPKAGALYKKILKLKPDHEHALLQAAEICGSQGLLVDARTYLNTLIERGAAAATSAASRRSNPAGIARSRGLRGAHGGGAGPDRDQRRRRRAARFQGDGGGARRQGAPGRGDRSPARGGRAQSRRRRDPRAAAGGLPRRRRLRAGARMRVDDRAVQAWWRRPRSAGPGRRSARRRCARRRGSTRPTWSCRRDLARAFVARGDLATAARISDASRRPATIPSCC